MDTRKAFSAFRHQIWITCAVHFRVHYSIWKAAVKEIGTRSTKNTMDIKNTKAVVTNKPQSDYYIYCLLHTEFIPSCLNTAPEMLHFPWVINSRSLFFVGRLSGKLPVQHGSGSCVWKWPCRATLAYSNQSCAALPVTEWSSVATPESCTSFANTSSWEQDYNLGYKIGTKTTMKF